MRYVHITGFARAGTTLLKNLFVCFKGTYVSKGEISRIGFIPPQEAGDRVIVTKHPNDINKPDQLFSQPDTHLIFLIRDPRDRICSASRDLTGRGKELGLIRKATSARYFEIRVNFLKNFQDRYLLVKYEDIIQRPEETQKRIAEYCDLEIEIPFTEGWTRFLETETEDYMNRVMNGLRPLDDRAVGRWRSDEFQDAVQEYVNNNPLVKSFIEKFYSEKENES